jgi:MFS family permease
VFAVAFTIFPPSKRNIVSPMIGLVATLAPTIGPTVGGYLSHAFSWHWLFLVNVVPGIIVAIAVFLELIDFDKPDHSLFEEVRLSSGLPPWRCFSARWNMCSKKAAQRLVRRYDIVYLAFFACWAACCSSGAPLRRSNRLSSFVPFGIATSPSDRCSPSSWASASTA